jgi:Zn-dependent peptidase ImmA (M78 family)
MSVFKPTTMLAYSDQRRLASEVLSDDQRLRLRELAFDKYRDVTRSLPAQHRLPAPLDFIEREGVVVQRRVLAPGQGGYNDPDSRTIYLSNDIHKNSPWERLVLAHEYWHLVLGHSSESNSKRTELLEAEATYAAIHYLIPVHTFGIIAKQIERRFDSARKRHRSLAETYAVPETVISQYQGEFV